MLCRGYWGCASRAGANIPLRGREVLEWSYTEGGVPPTAANRPPLISNAFVVLCLVHVLRREHPREGSFLLALRTLSA